VLALLQRQDASTGGRWTAPMVPKCPTVPIGVVGRPGSGGQQLAE